MVDVPVKRLSVTWPDPMRSAARWGLALVAAAVPPGLSLIPLAALWLATATWYGRRGIGVSAALSMVALIGNVILYAGL